MSQIPINQRFELHFCEGKPPELLRSVYSYDNQPEPAELDREKFEWGPGAAAFSLCFVKYRLWASDRNAGEDFCFRDEHGKNPVNTLAGLLETDTWVKSFFDTGFPTRTRRIFAPLRGDYRKGTPGRPRTVRVNRKEFPPEVVQINRGNKKLTKEQDLEELAVLLEEQWRLRSKLPALGKSGVKEVSDRNNRASAVAKPESTPLPSLYPFLPIKEAGHLFRAFGFSPRKEPLPSQADFVNGLVYQRSLFSTVLDRLARDAYAVIVGEGAAGKTTLALQVAFNRIKAKLPVFFLDINEVTARHQDGEAVAATSIAARHRCLLILDNAHLNGALASAICHEWKRAPRNSQVLMISREAKEDAHLAEWMNDPLRLTVEEKDLVGTLETVARRFLPPWDWVQAIHPDHIHEWSKAFGGNLVAFTIAATERIEALRKGEMDLGPEDARSWIEENYLDKIGPLNGAEREGLLRLAVLGQFELRVPRLFLEDPLERSQCVGIAHKILISRREGYEFALTHAAFGKLLLTAVAKKEVNQLSVLRAFMEEYPERADNMVHAVLLGSEGEPPTDPAREHAHYGVTRVDARQLFREWIASPNWKGLEATSLEEPQPSLQEYFSRMFSAGFEGEEPLIDHAFLAHADRVIELALNVQFELLLEFLVKAEKILPQTHAMLLKEFKSPQRRSEVISLFLQSQGGNSDDFERPPRTKTEKFQIWLLDEAVAYKNSQVVLDFVWRANLHAASAWLKRLRKTNGAAKFRKLLNQPASVKLATVAFFDYQAAGGREVDQHGVKALTEALRLIQEEMPKEVVELFKAVFSDTAIQERLAERLSIVPKDEPGLKTLWKKLTDFIPDKQLNVIKRSVGTMDGEQLLQEHGKPMAKIKSASSS